MLPERFVAAVRGLEPAPFHFAVALGLAGGLLLLVLAFRRLGRSRLMENLPTSRLRSAAQGYVELEGHARPLPGAAVVAPLTGTPCCWWQYRIEEKQQVTRNGRSTTEWRTVESACSEALFQFCDPTGEAVVNPLGAEVHPSVSLGWSGRSRWPEGPPGGGLLAAAFARYRYHEARLMPGDPLYVLGWFASQNLEPQIAPANALREALAGLKRDPVAYAALDGNGDGRVDAEEWEAARQRLAEGLRREAIDRSVNTDLHVLQVPPDRRPFLLSSRAQAELIRQGRRASALALCSGSALLLLTLAGLMARGMVR